MDFRMRPTSSSPRPPSRRCPFDECDGEGFVIDEVANTARPCRCRDQLIGHAVTRRARTTIPKAFRGVSFGRPPLNEIGPVVTQHVERFIDDMDARLAAGRGLWFFGDSDEALVSLAMLIARKASEGGASVATHAVPRLLMELRASYDSETASSHAELFARLCSVDLLVLTDLGAHRQSDWVLEQLSAVLNERWQDQRSVVVTMTASDPDRQNLEQALATQVENLRRSVEANRDAESLRAVVRDLESLIQRLKQLDERPWADPFDHMKRQLGSRNLARLLAMCDDPVPVGGPVLPPASRR